MKLPDRLLLPAGLWCLALANLSHWWLQRRAIVSAEWSDGVFGLSMGVAIGVLVLAIIRRSREQPACR